MENGDKKNAEDTLLDRSGRKLEVKPYLTRWVILLIFIWYAAVNSFQWIEYATITHIVMKYYNVSSIAVDWTCIIYMATYPFLVIPASYVIDKKGLRMAGLIGCIGTFVAAAIKLLSLRTDLFAVVMLGQFISAASQLFILCLPPKIAAVWFKSNEVSTACSLGVFGTLFGNAIGFIIPPLLVKNSESIDEIGHGLKLLTWAVTASMMPVTIAVLIYFPDEPPLPPSVAQAKVRDTRQDFEMGLFFKSVGELFKNKGFVIHMIAYGINVAVYSALGTLLSQFVHARFQDNDELGGKLGFIMIMIGMGGAIVFGIILDKTHWYKEMCLLNCAGASISCVGFMYALYWQSEIMCYLTCAIVGIFTNAYMPVGFEMAMELTYPSEESTTTGILMAMTQILGSLFTIGAGYLNMYFGYFNSLAVMAVLLAGSVVITYYVPNIKRRQDAYNSHNVVQARKPSFHGSKLLFIQ